MRVLIGGGSGFVGKHLTSALRQNGVKVTWVSREPGPNRITWRDLNRNGLPTGTTAVVNVAGENILNVRERWNDSFKKKVVESRISTTTSLARAIQQSEEPPNVFVCMSGVARYQPSSTAEYNEDTPSPDYDFLSKLTTDWENAADIPSSDDVRVVKVKSGVVLGRDGGMIQQVFYPFFLGVGGNIASGKQWFPWIHVDDVAGILEHAIQNDHVTGVLNAVSPEPVTNADFTRAFARAMWRPAIFPTPGFVLNTVFGLERAKVMLEGQKVYPKRTLESGYKFIYPDLQSACREFSRIFYATEIELN